MNPYKTLLSVSLCLFGLSLGAYETGYVFHFNVDENLDGSDEPIVDSNWNLHYGPTAQDGGQAANNGSGDGSIVSGLSEGSTGGIPKPLDQFSNNDRGFIFGSGVGDATTGFAPQAMFFWTTNLTAVNTIQGAKASGSVQTDWGTPVYPPTQPMVTLALGNLVSISAQTKPRNTALVYRIAIQIAGTWYVDAAGFSATSTSPFETYALDISSASLYPLPFTPGSDLDTDVTDNGSVTVASLDPALPVTGYGMYVDTGSAKGSQNNTGTWARMDAYYINAPAPVGPPIESIAVGGGSFTINADTAIGLSYQLLRDTDLQGSYSTTVGPVLSGTGDIIPLEDPDYGTLGAEKVFYKVDVELE